MIHIQFDYIISPNFGLEYSVNDKFSISSEAYLNLEFPDNGNIMDTSSKLVFLILFINLHIPLIKINNC